MGLILPYAGAPAAPAGRDWATEFAALSNLIGVWEFPSEHVEQSGGDILSVQSFAQSSGNDPVVFSSQIGKYPKIGMRDGVNCAVFADGDELAAPSSILTTPATLFIVLHAGPGETAGNIFGDFNSVGGGLSVLLAGPRDTGVELRARNSTTFGDVDHAVKFGWHCVAIQIGDGELMTAVFDGLFKVTSQGEPVDFDQLKMGFGFSGGVRMAAVFDAAVIGGPEIDLCHEYWRVVSGANR